MPSVIPLRRPRLADSDDEDEERDSVSREGTPLSTATSDSKRARRETDDGEDASQSSSPSGGPVLTNGLGKRAADANDEPSDKHQPGAIVRVKLTNFVTYTSAEFYPGPNLNMVIGPNGTGKSTLVCAICLGLGWGPQHLGRAKDVAEFVKHGCREATIEIELQADHRFRHNPVISRTIKREGNKSTFMINNRASSKNNVLELAKTFSIQIDNLCQFLPQDKVCEFAALTPIQLLESTQRAAAPPHVLENHENLKKLRGEQRKLQTDTKNDKEALATLQARQDTQRADVENILKRKDILKQVEWMERCRPIPRYRDARSAAKEAKERRKIITEELAQLKEEVAPALRAVNDKQIYMQRIEAALKPKKRALDQADDVAQKTMARISQIEEEMKECDQIIEAEAKGYKNRRQEVKRIESSVSRLRIQMEEEPPAFDAAAHAELARQNAHQMREIENRWNELSDKGRDLHQQGKDKQRAITEAEGELAALNTQAGLQERLLKQMSPDSYRAWQWVKANQDKFEQTVFGPPMVTCTLKKPEYASAIESLFQKNDFLAFTVQNRNDFRILQEQFFKQDKLHDVSLKTCSVSRDRFTAPISDEQMRALTFDGWAIDLMDGPEPVLTMLCSEKQLHQTAIKSRDISDDDYRRIEASPINSYVCGKVSYQTTRRREYGAGATSTRTREIKPARVWTQQAVDTTAKRGYQENIGEWGDNLNEIREMLKDTQRELNEIKGRKEDLRTEKADLDKEKAAKQTALTTFRGLPTKLATEEGVLEQKVKEQEATGERVKVQRDQKDELLFSKAEVAVEYAEAVEHLRTLHEDLLNAELMSLEAISDYETLKSRNAEVNELLKTKTREEDQAMQEHKELSDKALRIHQEVKDLVAEGEEDQGLKAFLDTFDNKQSPDDLEASIDSAKASLELTHDGGNTNVLADFEKRQAKIDKLSDKLSTSIEQLEAFTAAITEIRETWEPELDALIAKISAAFSDSFARIGCAGQVGIYKADSDVDSEGDGADFDHWAIQIQVKFREHESLSVLDSHRQSGGERAVSTIFYLMALQSLSASPFRVVDEINQGMDPRNERMVHARMVEIACSRDSGSQYFLITPKLLTGLVYKRGMKVHCIVSGDYMPQEYAKVEFRGVVSRMKALQGSGGGGMGVNGGERRVDSGVGMRPVAAA